MPEFRTDVSNGESDQNRLPDGLARYPALVAVLRSSGILDELPEKLRLERRHGYAGIDLFLFLLCFFCQREAVGLRPFRARFAAHGRSLAALGGRASWPSQASMSRAMESLSGEQVEAFGEWLLGRPLADTMLRDACEVLHTDGIGRRWHVLDLDATVTPFRRRALPEGAELPEPRRRAGDDLAQPGYSGRKRGEAQLARLVLQHAGSGCWLGSWADPGNGDARRAMAHAADIAGRWRSASAEVVLRFDGGLGSVPAMATCRRAGVRFLTRVARYEWLKTDEARAWLDAARWTPVADAGSGPAREAVDFGPAQLVGSEGNAADRERLEVRVVLSRFRNDGARRGVGVVLDGWQYEMYATDLPPDGWPAAATVTAYYGRCGQENRFGQEDRELGLDRTFSYHLPGQHFACIVGLFVWNLESALGARLVPLTAVHADGCSIEPQAVAPPSSGCREDARPKTGEPAGISAPDPSTPVWDAPPALERIDRRVLAAEATRVLEEWAGSLLRANWLASRPGWDWQTETHRPICPAGEQARLHNVRRSHGGVRIEFRVGAGAGACRDCRMRAGCTRSTHPKFCKEAVVHLSPGTVSGYSTVEALARVAPGTRGKPPPEPRPPRPARAATRSRITPGDGLPSEAGGRQPRRATLVPSHLRREAREVLTARTCRVDVDMPVSAPREVPWLAETSARRQHRRRTHLANVARLALPDGACVRVVLDGPPRLHQLIRSRFDMRSIA